MWSFRPGSFQRLLRLSSLTEKMCSVPWIFSLPSLTLLHKKPVMLKIHLIPKSKIDAEPDAFNCSNLWKEHGTPKPADYEDVCRRFTTSKFMNADQRSTVVSVPVRIPSWMLKAATTIALTGDAGCLKRLYADELESTVAASPQVQAVLDAVRGDTRGCFVRSESVSCKEGVHGPGPYTTAAAVFESIITARTGHTPMIDVRNGTLDLFVFPWRELDARYEFRVFVWEGKAVAVSQQRWFEPFAGDCSVKKLQALMWRVIACAEVNVADFSRRNGCPPTAVADVAMSVSDDKPVFLELNPYGGDYSSGSALFHWALDAEILTPSEKIPKVVVVRLLCE